MNVGIYLRVSTDEQRERQSIETQRDFAQRYCELHSLPITATYADDGISGTVPLHKRPAGCRMVTDARQHRIDQLLVYRLDRLGRDTRLILNAVAELEECGVRVRSLSEEFDNGTASGRLMLTLLSGFAAHEREVIRERSLAGTQRRAMAGAWLGGIVPYAYRKEGERGQARLVLAEAPIPGLQLSEVDVIRLVFEMAALEKASCQKISEHLNALNVPCAYTRDGRQLLRGKRKINTAGLWRPGRVRYLLASTTYLGQHQFGKRGGRQIITRAVPAIVEEQIWQQAQQTLASNRLFVSPKGNRQYLLRGLIKCGLCGLNYSGQASWRDGGKAEVFYVCNGKQAARGLYGKQGRRCPARSVGGRRLEQLIWNDITHFLSHPSEVIDRLQKELHQHTDVTATTDQMPALEEALRQKETERDRILTLFRKGRIDETVLDQHLDEIASESAELRERISRIRPRLGIAGPDALDSVAQLLTTLRTRLQEPVDPEWKWQLVRTLVASIRVDTVETEIGKQAHVSIRYRFPGPTAPSAEPLCLTTQHGPKSTALDPASLGYQIRRKRLSLGLTQEQLGEQLGVCEATVHNWETGIRNPKLAQVPIVQRLLDAGPVELSGPIGEQLKQYRRGRGITQNALAKRLQIDPSTLARWERGEREPTGRLAECVSVLLGKAKSASAA